MRKHFFTLVELLIVIGIIIILAGILLPVTSSALKKADQTKALAMAKTLENAIKSFKSDYQYYPPVDNYENLILALQGKKDSINPRKTRYIDVQENTIGQYKDPWDTNFVIYIDDNYDGAISLEEEIPGVVGGKSVNMPGTGGTTVTRYNYYFPVIVYSKGPDTLDGDITKNADNIYSFPTVLQKGNDGKKVHVISK